MRRIIAVLSWALALLIGLNSPADAANLANGAKVFSANCAACHVEGGNLINATKTLKKLT